MNEMDPITMMTNAELEAWFAAAGLTVVVVDRCPDPTCGSCSRLTFADAA